MLKGVSHSSFQYKNSTIQIRQYGETGLPIVLIHGLSGSAHWWDKNLKTLSQSHRVYILELAGYGRAGRQKVLGVRQTAELIGAWLEASQLNQVTLIGHSMGGHISTYVAAQQPTRISHLILVCASGLLNSSLSRTLAYLPQAALSTRKTFLPQIMFDAARAGLPNLFSSTSNLLADNVQDILPQIKIPTLVIWGKRDPLVPLALGELLSQSITGAKLVVFPRAGHIPMVDEPKQFNKEVLDFLATEARVITPT